MRIYLKTPLVNFSKILAHLTEHCVGHHMLQVQDFFELSYGVDGISASEHTLFEYDEWINPQEAMDKLFLPPQLSAFLYEQTVIAEELSDNNYEQRLQEAVLQHLVNPKISLNQNTKCSFEEILAYHKQHYHAQNAIVVDQDYKVIYQGFDPIKEKESIPKSIARELDFEEDTYLLFANQDHSSESFWELYFYHRMLSFHTTFHARWKEKRYFYLTTNFYSFQNIHISIIPKEYFKTINQMFFEEGKKYLLKMFHQGYFKEKFFLNKYFYGLDWTREKVINYYTDYQWSDFLVTIQKYT